MTSLGPSPQSSIQCQQTFPWCTVCLVWLALGAREVPYAQGSLKLALCWSSNQCASACFGHLVWMNEGDLSSCSSCSSTLDLTSRVPQGVYGEFISQVSPLWQQQLVCKDWYCRLPHIWNQQRHGFPLKFWPATEWFETASLFAHIIILNILYADTLKVQICFDEQYSK